LVAKTYREACDLSRRAQGKAISKQTFEILSKVREVDKLVTPKLQTWVFEVHPEVSFWMLNGRQPLKHRKSTREGREERLQLLLLHYPEIERHLAQLDKSKAAEDDLLDAAVAAWTAERVVKGEVVRQYDARGLRMEIVY